MTKFYGGKRSKQMNNRATENEVTRIARHAEKLKMSQTDTIHFAVLVWDAMSETERQQWIKDLLS